MLSFFKPMKNVHTCGLLCGMTDVHTHLLPGVDDGAQTHEEAYKTLTYLEGIGVERLYLTPHIMSDFADNHPAMLRRRFDAFVRTAPEKIEMRLAGEYMLDSGFYTHLTNGLFAMADGHVLVETSYLAPPPDLSDILYEIALGGYTPVLAHPERYGYMRDKDRYALKEKGYRFQLNLMSLSGTYGRPVALVASELLKKGFYDFVGSDVHKQSVYEASLSHLYLTNGQITGLSRLLDNNRQLW